MDGKSLTRPSQVRQFTGGAPVAQCGPRGAGRGGTTLGPTRARARKGGCCIAEKDALQQLMAVQRQMDDATEN